MKRSTLVFLLILLLVIIISVLSNSCSSVKYMAEDELFMTRKYVGNYIDCQLLEKNFGDPPTMFVNTNYRDEIGNIYIYSKKCDFVVGERLYIRRYQQYMGAFNVYWIYILENDSKSYRLRQFEFENKLLVQAWY